MGEQTARGLRGKMEDKQWRQDKGFVSTGYQKFSLQVQLWGEDALPGGIAGQ